MRDRHLPIIQSKNVGPVRGSLHQVQPRGHDHLLDVMYVERRSLRADKKTARRRSLEKLPRPGRLGILAETGLAFGKQPTAASGCDNSIDYGFRRFGGGGIFSLVFFFRLRAFGAVQHIEPHNFVTDGNW